MLTVEDLHKMSPNERTAAFDVMCRQIWPNAKSLPKTVAAELGITTRAYSNWRQRDAVPTMAMLLLSEWTMREEVELSSWQATLDDLAGLSASFEQLRGRLHDLIDHRVHALTENDEGEL